MEIEESSKQHGSMDARDTSNWMKMMNFITKQEKLSFRQCLNSINSRLYSDLQRMVEKKWPKLKEKTEEIKELCDKLNSKRKTCVFFDNYIRSNNPESPVHETMQKLMRKSTHKNDSSSSLPDRGQEPNSDESTLNFLHTMKPEMIVKMVEELRNIDQISNTKTKRFSKITQVLNQFRESKKTKFQNL